MRHGRALDLGRTDALAGDLERVIGAALDEPIAVLVDERPVAVDPRSRDARPVRLEVALAVLPEAAGHARQRLAQHQLANLATHGCPVRVDHVGGRAHDGPPNEVGLIGVIRLQETMPPLTSVPPL